ncbi:MAG: S-layer homology domain-containing protein [Oscillospiraceae bacterium]|jgi:hypothetical protein|nr:S-layer homology domain-containing protein [Oscillospiraceae bacterium]
MKKRQNKIVSMLLAALMILAGFPASTLPAAALPAESGTVFASAADGAGLETADIFLSVQDGGYIVPKQAATVTADLSARYGYEDVEGTVSGLDALLKAHQIRYALTNGAYDEAGFAAWVRGAVTVSELGYVTAAFGKSKPDLSLLVDGEMPGEDGVAFAIPDMPVAGGDNVEFLIYQDADALDYYTWFEDETGKTEAVTAAVGENLTLTLKGDMLLTMMFGRPLDGDRIIDTGACEDLPIVTLDPDTGAPSPFAPAVTADEDGAFTVRFAEPGTYILSARGDAYADIFAPWCVVTVFSDSAAVSKLEIGGGYKTQYVLGEAFSAAGMVITATFSDGGRKVLTHGEVEFTGFDSAVRGAQTVTVRYKTAQATFKITVLYPETSGPATINVYLTLYGDTVHTPPEDGGPTHTLQHGGLTLWIPRNTVVTVSRNATVLDVLEKAMTQEGLTWENPSGQYIASVTKDGVTLGGGTNGAKSGWMYTLNGRGTLNGVAEQYLENNDRIVFHYTDDYELEEGGEFLKPGGGQTGATGGAEAPFAPKPQTDPFIDVTAGSWYYEAVGYVHENDLMHGADDGVFDPDGRMTRDAFVMMLHRYEGKPAVAMTAATSGFIDVADGMWYSDAIFWAIENGIAKGYGSVRFGPVHYISREQIAIILIRFAQMKGHGTESRSDLTVYADADKISDWAQDAVRWANAEGLLRGRSGTRLAADEAATRAEAAMLFMRFAEILAQ